MGGNTSDNGGVLGPVRNIVELARLAGVSAGTVSRALAGNPLVKARTREKIQAIARQHDFKLNQMASRLRTKRTGLIGVVIPLGHERRQHISDPFFMRMLGALADVITESGNGLVLHRVIPDNDEWLVRIASSGLLDGVLIIGQSDQFDVIEQAAARNCPIVAWGQYQQGQRHYSVGTDNFAAGKLAARHLIERGAQRLAFLGDLVGTEIPARYDGFKAEANAHGLDVTPLESDLAANNPDTDIIRHAGLMEGMYDGVLAASDVIAMRTLRALADRSINVPGQVAVVGFDDLPLAKHTVPRLTTIRQDIQRGAQEMVAALFRQIAGESVESVIMPPQLVVRDSA